MGYTRFERFFRAAGGVDVGRNDMKRYLDFVNRIIYDLLIAGQAETFHEFRKLNEERARGAR